MITTRVAPIPVSKNESDTTENAGIGIGEHATLCTDWKPCDLSAANRYPAASH